jgi:hypothetical protein
VLDLELANGCEWAWRSGLDVGFGFGFAVRDQCLCGPGRGSVREGRTTRGSLASGTRGAWRDGGRVGGTL